MAIKTDVLDLAERVFSLKLPFTREELKTAFKREAKKLHTDISGGDTKEDFIRMKEAYDVILSFDEFFRADFSSNLITIEGIPLSQLGLGLGPMKNGRDCERCARKGYEEKRVPIYESVPCVMCYERGVPCRPCQGTGKFTQARSKKVVTCRVCDGTKYVMRKAHCYFCGGTSYRQIPTERFRTVYHKCFECGGSGEIELFNPVLPKGRLYSSK